MQDEKLYQLALWNVPGLGAYLSRQLISYCGSAKNVFLTPKGKLLKIPGVGAKLVQQIASSDNLKLAEELILETERQGASVISISEPEYPLRLRQIADAPPLLFTRCNTDLNATKVVSIVGTRSATDYGRAFTEELVASLVRHKALIVSGLAYGIDIAAHKAAIKNGLPTVAIIAGGLDKVYPSIHKATAKKMLDNGGLITEYKFGVMPDKMRFPARNRLIAGMADAVVVVEAAKKGGALITANLALDYDRDVFALPGDVGKEFSEGCNNLIKTQKAQLLTSVSDLEYAMNWDETSEQAAQKRPDISSLEPMEKTVMESLIDQPGIIIDQLSWKTQIPVNQLASILLTLEFQGLVRSLPGKKYTVC